MSDPVLKCSIIVSEIPLEQFRLPTDGRKWNQSARSRAGLLQWLSGKANSDGSFERNGKNYSPSEKRIVKRFARKTYYRLSGDLRKLGWLSWTREQNYKRRLFTIHLDNHVPDLPETPARFDENDVSYPQETQKRSVTMTRVTMGHYPSSPNTSLESSTRDATSSDHKHDIASVCGGTIDASSAPVCDSAAASDSDSSTTNIFSHVGGGDPSVQPNRREGRLDHPLSVKENDEVAESAIDFAVDDEHPMPSAVEMAAEERRRSKQDYAIDKSKEWRKVPKDIRDRVKALVKKMESEWEHWATHDEDGEIPSDEKRKAGSFCPSDEHLLMLAGLLQTYTDFQVLRAWNKYLLRTQGFDGVLYPIALFIKHDFAILVEDKEKSSEEVHRHEVWNHPPLEAFVAGLSAEPDYDGWIAQCPFPKNHQNGDADSSLVINQNEDGKVLVHCRAGCNQSEVWNAAVEAARDAIADGSPLPSLPEGKAQSKKEFDVDRNILIFHATHARLNQVPEVQSWLQEWGITSEVAKELQLGASSSAEFIKRDETKFRSPAVIIPHFDRVGNLVGLKARATSEKVFTQANGSSTAGLFAVAHLNPDADDVLVLEGDKDVAIAMSHGFNATGILSSGSSVSDADIEVLATYKRIYLIGDQDKAGIAAMDRLAERLPEDRVTRVHLSVNDIGELYRQHPSDFENRLKTLLHGEMAFVN